jgi:multiple sugar transport system ATP-binding protein
MHAMAGVTIDNVVKRFARFEALKGVSAEVRDGELMVVLGPSGCGKSTLLRLIAGLEEITSGEIRIGDRRVNDLEPKDRDIAMVFQNYALYPHMSVYDNMAYGLRNRRMAKPEIDRRVRHAASILGLADLLARKPRQLSGGQRQRVAMGRAIVRDPQVFLFDEPLSNLDAKLRVQMRTEVKELHQRLKTTSVYVTHDQIEAMTMADRIVVMNLGNVEQIGAPLELYDRPNNLFVAGFIGSPAMNFIDATIKGGNGGGGPAAVTADGTELPLPATIGGVRNNQRVIYGIRPEHLTLNTAAAAANGNGNLPSEVVVVEPTGAEILVFTRTAGHEIAAVFRERHAFQPGDRISLTPDLGAVHVFDAETGARLN